VHSRLSPGERYDTWRRARSGELDVIVGPRSALFAPLARLGLIVLDECHDGSYDQDDNPPSYHAVSAALTYARLTGSVIILGSATPEITQRYQAQEQGWTVLSLPNRILAHREQVSLPEDSAQSPEITSLPLPPVTIVDMRQELQMGNRSIFSRELTANLERALSAGQQAILFLNRRGSATYVFCRACGHVLKCPRCDLPLTYHVNQSGLLCHTCGYTRQMPTKCPQCKSDQIRQYGAGTERVEREVQERFPTVRTLRLDAETVQQKGSHEIILSHFVHHRADVLIGTQMLAKGLDLPLVTFVGVVLADVGLNFPDYRAGERGFQLLSQVVGRAGRSPLGGRAVIQTFNPDHYAIQLAALHDYDSFYEQELEYRRQIQYPPFTRLARLEYRHARPERAEAEARSLAARLSDWLQQGGFAATDLIGPVPCFYDRVNGEYRWQIIVRGPNPAAVLRGRSLENWRIEIDPASLL
ncbi:MAG TPA: primosomal protein N', partial [Anaerolineaceae bacterium]|nr:primosomal protein N' [Anaerolineaceae bacterium]